MMFNVPDNLYSPIEASKLDSNHLFQDK